MDYTLTKKDVEKRLGKSSKTVSRYIKNKKLNPIKTKRGKYEIYLFCVDEVVELEGGHPRGQGTKVGDTPDTQESKKQGRVNILNGETEGTKVGDKTEAKDTTGDTKDRTQGTPELELLKETIDILKQTLNNQSKQIDSQSRQIDNLTNTQQFLINENSGFRKMLGLGTTREEIIDGVKDGDIVDTGDIVDKRGGTKKKTPRKKRTKKTTKTNKGHSGQNPKNNKKITKVKEKKKRGFFSWILGD